MISRRFKRVLGFAVLAGMVGAADAPSSQPNPAVPPGYALVYEQHFDAPESLRQFTYSDPQAWKFSGDGASFALELAKQSDYQPTVRSPFNIALIGDRIFGDFVLEADLIQTGKEYGHRDMCLFFGVQDPAHLYYAHIATKTDDHAHNVFIVNQAPRIKISSQTTSGVNWGLGVWHRVRLERQKGKITVFFDDMKQPIMSADDQTFGAGWVGFGSFDDTGKVDNIRIWAPSEPERKVASFFRSVP
ncbi:MAG TPA: hypothetical protein PLX89_08265 [Verrucomicrobiota bacterium]|nr:hypothetical protein [Verrucomicrobiales bacterium]HRI12984.1 hypothetical protein [Verrucomicrobiota bacterium]